MAGERGTLLELDYGDTELVVHKHPDGKYTITIPEPFLLLDQEDFDRVVQAFVEFWYRRGMEPPLSSEPAGFQAIREAIHIRLLEETERAKAAAAAPTKPVRHSKLKAKRGCDHVFQDTPHCIKCGWNPNGDMVPIVEGGKDARQEPTKQAKTRKTARPAEATGEVATATTDDGNGAPRGDARRPKDRKGRAPGGRTRTAAHANRRPARGARANAPARSDDQPSAGSGGAAAPSDAVREP